jgi:hypothetical protein
LGERGGWDALYQGQTGKRRLWKWVFLSLSVREAWREGSFTGDSERYVKNALEMEHLYL